jgi:hypothetical protein
MEIPSEIKSLWGKPPLLPTEDPVVYDALCARIAKSVEPADVVFWILIKDVADLTWETLRFRRLKTQLLLPTSLQGKVYADLIASPVNYEAAEMTVLDVTLANLEMYERIDALIALAEARRATALREMERRHHVIGARLRAVSDQIIEGECSNDPPKPPPAKSAVLVKKPTLVASTHLPGSDKGSQ